MSLTKPSVLAKVTSAHFTGIKGVGMTAAALCLQDLGITVSGSDIAEDFVTRDVLKQRHIIPQANFSFHNLIPAPDIEIYTGAHGGINNPEVQYALKQNIKVLSHAEAVGVLMQNKQGVSVCGVGGKTSTSAMITTILDYAGAKPSYCIGVGKVMNLQVPGRMDNGPHFIAEADEYVVSPGTDHTPRFNYQTPDVIVCTNVSHDHPDIYQNIEETKKAFQTFFHKITQKGLLVLNGSSGPLRQIDVANLPVIWYGLTPHHNDWWIEQSFTGEGKQMVQIQNKQHETYQFTLSVPGQFNAQNALAAFIVARQLGIKVTTITEALQLFRGSLRRFEKVGERGSVMLYDDYAHHPSQLFATLQAARQWLPLYRIIAVFQPHTYSRTKALLEQFAKSFTYADHVIITDIYASSRENIDPSISGFKLAEAVKNHHASVEYIPRNDLVAHLKATLQDRDALFTLGAGDIYQIHQDLCQ